MIDRWFGSFIETLRDTGLLDTSLVAVISDHGHNIGHEPGDKGLISKQGHPMTHAVADLVLMMRHPEGQGAGTTYDGLVYNLDVTSTFFRWPASSPGSRWTASTSGPRCSTGEPRARARHRRLGAADHGGHRRVVVQCQHLGRGRAALPRARGPGPGAQPGRGAIPRSARRCWTWPSRTPAAASRTSLPAITTSRAARPLRTDPRRTEQSVQEKVSPGSWMLRTGRA